MQMDSSNLDQADKSSPEALSDSSLCPDSPDNGDIFGEPRVNPRVGDEYQVAIPSILSESELALLMMNPVVSDGVNDSSHAFAMGLPLQVMWVSNQANSLKAERIESHQNPHAVCTNGLVDSENFAMKHISAHMEDSNFKVDALNQTSLSNGCSLLPGRPTESCSDFEVDCFLLGLYMLGKNLLHVTRFVESKGMGQILAYYYGQFYGSPGYRRWSACRKMRNKKCVIGHRFFTGYRQQELFSRLFPHLPEESRTKILEASRAFTEGRTSLDEYVFTLKALAGIHALVEAVGIGKGKADLTTLIFDGSKNNQMFSHRPEIPSGKACSSLTCAEIVKYLTGDFRLSKARSNDLFWEAVWPRLLARGWHSEQPRGDGYTGSKHCLVFLMPGIKKFSRRKLSKGDHYFDSVTDVLSKVASEPELLELEADETKPSSSKEENGWNLEVKSDDDPSDHERHCYLKPRVSSGFSNLEKFTVIDTSLANEDNPYKVRELRSLPAEVKRCSVLSHRTRNSETESKVNADILTNGLQLPTVSPHSIELTSDHHGCQRMPGPGDANLLKDYKSRTIKHQFSRRIKPGLSSCAAPLAKRRRCSYVETDVTCVLSLPARNKNTKLKIIPPKMSQTDVIEQSMGSSVVGTLSENIQGSLDENHVDIDISLENKRIPRPQIVIDLNLPHILSDSDFDGIVKLEEGESSANQKSDAEKPNYCVAEKEMHLDGEIQRHSDAEDPNYCKAEKADHLNAVKLKHSDYALGPSYNNDPLVSAEKHEYFDDEKPKHSKDALGPLENKVSLVSAEAQKPEHFDAEEPKHSEDAPGPPDNKGPLLSPVSAEPSNKGRETDQQPRRLSTRSRPLTTKALEALEIGFLNPVRHYRKRSPSTMQEQKPKRSRQPRSKSSMFPHDMAFDVKAADETCNGKPDTVGNFPMGRIPTEKETMTCKLLGLSEVSFPPGAS